MGSSSQSEPPRVVPSFFTMSQKSRPVAFGPCALKACAGSLGGVTLFQMAVVMIQACT